MFKRLLACALAALFMVAPAGAMDSPGPIPLGSFTITTAGMQCTGGSCTAQQPQNFAGIVALACQVRFAYGAGGTNVTAYVQTTLDQSQTWIDIAASQFTTTGGVFAFNVSALDKVTTPLVPTDGTLSPGSVITGILGSALRAKVISTGTYSLSSQLSVSCEAR